MYKIEIIAAKREKSMMQKEHKPQPRGRPVPGVAQHPGFLNMEIYIFRKRALTSLKIEIRQI